MLAAPLFIFTMKARELLLDGHNNLNVQLFSDEFIDGAGDRKMSFENLFNHIAANQQLAKAMLGKKGGNMMTEFFKNNIALKIKKRYGSQFGKSKAGQKLLNFLSDASGAAVVSLLVSWIEDEMPFTAKEMSLRCQNLVTAVFEKISV